MGQTQHTMSTNTHLRTWVSCETKERFSVLARVQGVSESSLLKRLVEAVIGASLSVEGTLPPLESVPLSGRITVRLRADDLLLLRERATARGMPTATYVSLLVRSHLRRLAPLPDAELKALKYAIGELSAIGRNLNQIARAVNVGDGTAASTKADLQALLRACTGLRDAVKGLVSQNLDSWEAGRETTRS
jgi:Bacterial mobilisation protein (MobC)